MSEYGIQDRKLLLYLLNLHKMKKSNLTVGQSNLVMLTMEKNDVLLLDMITEMSNYLIFE